MCWDRWRGQCGGRLDPSSGTPEDFLGGLREVNESISLHFPICATGKITSYLRVSARIKWDPPCQAASTDLQEVPILAVKIKMQLGWGFPRSTGIFPWPELPTGVHGRHFLLYLCTFQPLPSQGRLSTHVKDNENRGTGKKSDFLRTQTNLLSSSLQ